MLVCSFIYDLTTHKIMKPLSLFYLFALSLSCFLASCVETENEVSQLSSLWYHGAGDGVIINGDNTETTLELKAECGWQLTTDGGWLTVMPASGMGNATVTVVADGPNPSHDNNRQGTVIFTTADGVKKRISVVQTPSTYIPLTLSVNKSLLSFDATNELSMQFDIVSNTGWTISADQPWVIFTPASGDGPAQITVHCLDNLTTQDRSCTLTVASGDLRQQVAITQKAAELPTLSALSILDVGETKASVSATIVQGTFVATECGFVWSTSPNPASDGQKCKALQNDGTTFAATLEGLAKKQLYYVCAYAVSLVGTVYGQVATFTTLSIPHEGDDKKPDF